MKAFVIIGCLAALSSATFFFAVLSIGASTHTAKTASAFLLGPAVIVSDSTLHPAGVVILLAISTFVVHFAYWWFAIMDPWPPKRSTRIAIIAAVHFGSVIVFWMKRSYEQMS